MLAELRRRGVDVGACRVEPELRTGLTVVRSAGGEDRAILTVRRGDGRARRRGGHRRAAAPPPSHLHVTSPHLQPRLRAGLPRPLRPRPRRRPHHLARPGLGPERRLGRGRSATALDADRRLPAQRRRGLPLRRAPTSPRRRWRCSPPAVGTVVVKLGADGAIAAGRRGPGAGRGAGRSPRSTPPAPATASPPASSAAAATGWRWSSACGWRSPAARSRPGRSAASTANRPGGGPRPPRHARRELRVSGSEDRLHRRRQRRVHRHADRRHPRLPRAGRGPISLHDIDARAARDRRPASPARSRREHGACADDRVPPRPPRGPRRRRLRDQHDPGRRPRRDRRPTTRSRPRYGLRQTIGDTLGVGGVFRALRTIPVMEGIAADMAAVCPDAWLLNYTNPMAMLCQATYMGTPQQRDRRPLPLGPEHDRGAGRPGRRPLRGDHLLRRRRQPPGLHPPLRARRRGPLPAPRRGDRARPGAEAPGPGRDVPAARLLPDRVLRALLRVPALVPARRRADRALPPLGRRVRRPAARRTWASTSAPSEALAAGRPLELEPSNEYAPQIIHSIETGEPAVVYGNVRNAGLIDNLPADCLRRGPLPGRRHRRQPGAGREPAAAAGGAQPDLPQRRRPDRPRRPRRAAGPRAAGGAA